MNNNNTRNLLITGVALGLSALLAVGCSTGGSSSGFSGTGGGGNNNNNGGGGNNPPAAPVLARVSVKGLAPAGTPGSSIVAFRGHQGPVEMLLSLISSNAIAAPGDVVLAGFTVTAYGPTGAVAGTAIADANGDATFPNLPPGNYRFSFSNPSFPNTTLMVLVPVAEGSTTVVTATPATTSATLIAIEEAGGPNNLAGLDVAAFNASAATNPSFQAVTATITSSLAAGTPIANPATGAITNPALETQAETAAASVVTVVGRYPADGQTNVARQQTPIFVTFSDAMDTSTLPPTYTGWQVVHVSPSTGVTATVTPANLAQYGSWSYSDSARTASGVTVPAHSLLFTHSATLTANARETFTWQFANTPKASNGTVLTTSAQTNVAQTWEFFTGP